MILLMVFNVSLYSTDVKKSCNKIKIIKIKTSEFLFLKKKIIERIEMSIKKTEYIAEIKLYLNFISEKLDLFIVIISLGNKFSKGYLILVAEKYLSFSFAKKYLSSILL